MSLWSSLLETYDEVQNIVGVVPLDGEENPDVSKALLPLHHTTLKTQLCVTLGSDGLLRRIERDSKDVTIIVPCTEKSMGRAGTKPVPHPLCDQLQYVDGAYDVSKFDSYMKQLADWKSDNVKLNAIYHYLSEHSILEDANNFDIHLCSSTDASEKAEYEKDRKLGVRFSVEIPGDHTPYVWSDKIIQDLWIAHQSNEGKQIGIDNLGEALYELADSFPKKIVSVDGNAKLISANDNTNFTFRGRFSSKQESLRIDKLTSQKLHSTLAWIVSNNGSITEKQDIVIWAVDSNPADIINPAGNSEDLFADFKLSHDVTESDQQLEALHQIDTDYALQFVKILQGYGNQQTLKKHSRKIVVVIFDAATSGRLSVTFYRELESGEYIENILQWHIDSSWQLTSFTYDKKGKGIPVGYIGAPSFDDIVKCAYAVEDCSSASYKRFSKNVKKALLESMFGDRSLPRSILESAFHNVTRPMRYSTMSAWSRHFEIACSLWKKQLIQERKLITMELDEQRDDRDYLYGRLLALADNFESGVLYRQGVLGTRPTNAVKLMSNFVAKPFSTWGALWKQLVPYLKTSKRSDFFRDDVDAVMVLFKEREYENNVALSPLFLLGYSHERRALKQRTTTVFAAVDNKD
ncbi:type I-C CRISPR-associated protein Cas8c/Csd1 [Bifidobacterium psychraerophilum]|jgi:CRISPR-associated protein Csd1|uniref:type I-C CRISPR-associated protein Cas8c/Csd1 n=1 Tax=Bifidobacterium psychraerophilum TaxID=218140 RepID=UPI0023F3AF61|nr:type I-C CRISPR-associated protein Cas8c/Csd1 [Bifidobacterium psychraerophilum]MCI1659705.1 type I-C CRISPR-associated protein Cas8c/Csd1 [Bifidobacterium psychraerophilum]MCI1804738.1 type I-C CRISPR-associated protein Cas8c/Csd1 [Bifidobacterium psychraerophilum]MCI2176836.1 type I-C CRISPR-associated protein Cas8c/Csd1 [Bifidobacterium psychraerophilum]MCI2182578.1 type I-C CRISPR-associated protein Cas8c/Csd1 [Bifidobacterium psychraerophilum]